MGNRVDARTTVLVAQMVVTNSQYLTGSPIWHCPMGKSLLTALKFGLKTAEKNFSEIPKAFPFPWEM